MIYTFKLINGLEKRVFFAENIEKAEKEMIDRFGTNGAKQYSLISFVSAENFNLVYY